MLEPSGFSRYFYNTYYVPDSREAWELTQQGAKSLLS